MPPIDQVALSAAGRTKPHVDFQVSRNDEAHWTIQPVSEKAKATAVIEFGLDSRSPQDLGIVVGYIKSNALLHRLRSRGFSIFYNGPAGPITL
jgi:hypothetical protein